VKEFFAANSTHIVHRKLFIGVFFVFLFIVSSLLFPVRQAHAQGIITDKKLITVDIGKQMVYAWEGGKMIYSTKASTGMRYTPTVTGTFQIQRKIPLQNMKGNYPPYPPYDLKNVPNVMYFYQAYAIHGAYWHNKFGLKVTHGCVNVPVAASGWLFNWADVGTQVMVF